MQHTLRPWLAAIGAIAMLLALNATPVRAAPDPNAVETETIRVAPEDADGGEVAPEELSPDEPVANPDLPTAPKPDAPLDIPVVEYDLTKLPVPVARLREQIIEAAKTGDLEKLRPIIDANGEPPLFGPTDINDPIGVLKLESGDDGGREILAILIEVLEAGYVHADPGTPNEMYVWPYFARYPIDQLSGPQLVELFKLVYAGDYEEMTAYGLYTYFRAGISPDGSWKYFLTDD